MNMSWLSICIMNIYLWCEQLNMLILNMYSMNKLYQYRIFPIARLLGPPTILYFPLIFPHARLFGTLLLLGTLE